MNFNFGFDIIFLSSVALITLGSFFLGEEKSQRLMLGTILGVAASTQITSLLEKYIPNKLEFNGAGIGIILLLLPVIICLIGKNVRDSKYPKSKIKAVIGGFLSAFTLLGYVMFNLNNAVRENLVTDHNLAAMSYDLRILSLSILIVWLLVTFITVGKAKK